MITTGNCTPADPIPTNPTYGTGPFVYSFTGKVECCSVTISPASGGDTFDFGSLPLTADSCTSSVEVGNNGQGRAVLCLDSADGNAVVKLEQSIDGVKWFPFNDCSTFLITEDTQIILGEMNSKFYRICVCESDPQHNATTGSLDIKIFVNNE